MREETNKRKKKKKDDCRKRETKGEMWAAKEEKKGDVRFWQKTLKMVVMEETNKKSNWRNRETEREVLKAKEKGGAKQSLQEGEGKSLEGWS